MWAEAVHMCERIQNIMATTGSTKIQSEIFYGKKHKIIGSFSDFGRIAHVKIGEILRNI